MVKKKKFKISYLYKAYLPFLSKYFKKNISKNHILIRNKKLFSWFYKDNKKYNFFIAIRKKNIIGFQSYLPLNKFDTKLKFNQIFLTIFDVEKGSVPGLGLYIFKYLLTRLKPLFVGSIGINNKLINYHEFLGFKVFKMDHHFILSEKINNFKICKVEKINVLKKKININQYSVSNLNQNNIDDIPKNIFRSQSPLKSITYIKKRYIKNPFFNYLIYKVEKKKNICSILVIRKICYKGSTVLKLIDYFGSDKYIPISSYYCQQLVNINKAEYIDFYSYGIAKIFFKKSLFVNRFDCKNIIIPEYFEPFLKKNIDLICAYKNKMKNKVRLFKGDGDQDRPSII